MLKQKNFFKIKKIKNKNNIYVVIQFLKIGLRIENK